MSTGTKQSYDIVAALATGSLMAQNQKLAEMIDGLGGLVFAGDEGEKRISTDPQFALADMTMRMARSATEAVAQSLTIAVVALRGDILPEKVAEVHAFYDRGILVGGQPDDERAGVVLDLDDVVTPRMRKMLEERDAGHADSSE